MDLDAAVAAYRALADAQTAVNEANRKRNEHQAAGKKLPPEERKAHGLEGRRLKEEVAALEAQVERARAALGDDALRIGTVLHPSPASPKANRGWALQAEQDLRSLSIAI